MADLSAPRDDLVRLAESEIRASGDDGRTLTGYAAVFNSDTVINSWEGNFVERIAPGAFRKTLRERRDQIKPLFNHGFDPSIGDKPLGKPRTMKEDDKGLFVEVPLSRTSYNDDLIELLNDGAIDGMSFRFSVVKETWEEPKRGLPIRTITEAKLYEFGPVTFPAYAATSAGVRSREELAHWNSLPESKREAIRNILSTSTEAGETTSDEEAANQHEPETPTRASALRRRAALILRGIAA